MIDKNKILIFSLIILSTLISLFPPYSWGDEKLKTLRERNIIEYTYRAKIPFKQYDFLFNDIKKEFTFGKNKITLERHLIISELAIQLFLAFLFSVLIQFLYRKYSHKFLIILFPILTIFIGVIFILTSFNLFATWFQPNYSNINNEKNNIKVVDLSYLENYSFSEMNSIFNELDKGYKNNWNNKTDNFWKNIEESIVIGNKNLPKIDNYLVYKSKNKSLYSSFKQLLAKNDLEDKFPMYKGYVPPSGYTTNYDSLESSIDILKYNIFLNEKSRITKYLHIRKVYFNKYKDYWNYKIPLYKIYSIVILIFFVSLIFLIYRKLILKKIKNV